MTLSRAVVLERFGEPLTLREYEVPAPAAGELIVATRYGGICGTDLHLRQGHLDVPIPLVLGHEGLGVIEELGPGRHLDFYGGTLRAGDTVMWASSIACGQCVPCRLHQEPTLCARRRTYGVNRPANERPSLSGAWAEHIVLRENTTVVKVGDGIDCVAAMALACAGPTMVHAVAERRPVRVGEVVVVQGSGPVGLAAAALAELAGAGKVIVCGGPARRLKLTADAGIGQHHVNLIDADDTDAALAEVLELTGGAGADLVIECTGVPVAVAQGLCLARRGGSYVIVGQYTDAGDTRINPHQIVFRQLDLIGSWAFAGHHLAKYASLLPRLTSRFDLASLVTLFPLAEVNQAMEQVAHGEVMKAVLASGCLPGIAPEQPLRPQVAGERQAGAPNDREYPVVADRRAK